MKNALKIRDVSSVEAITDVPLETVSTDFVKIVPHRDAKGQVVSQKWDIVKGTVYGNISEMKKIEVAQPISVVFARARKEMLEKFRRGPEGWPK